MKIIYNSIILFLIPIFGLSQNEIPRLEKTGNTTQLIVDGEPYLILGGELFNNSATSLDFLEPLWEGLEEMNLNTVLPAISWAQFEPEEGKYNYDIVDGVIEQARKHDMRLVLLWFGSWKNTWSSYVPDWVKKDYDRFPRIKLRDSTSSERLSPFSLANQEADARAYEALMRHIKSFDGSERTVIMMQVQNEVGSIPDARDHSPAANTAFAGSVPQELIDYLVSNREALAPELREKWRSTGFKTSGSWEEVFGPGLTTEDAFMAWHYAKYIGKITEVGKAQYNLPMFTNAALIRTGYLPGQFNSGGPLPHNADMWKAGGPQLDFLSPDIYFEFKKWSDLYVRNENPLFIPEMRGGATGAANSFYAIGHHAAIGVSPFGIDRSVSQHLGNSYRTLSELTPLILKHQTEGNVEGVVLGDLSRAGRIQLGGYYLNLERTDGGFGGANNAQTPDPHAIFIASDQEEFYIAGRGMTITFSPLTSGPPHVGLGVVEEGQFVDGVWKPERWLAGDDTGQGNNIRLRSTAPGRILRVKVYRYR